MNKKQRKALQALADVMRKYDIALEAGSNSDRIPSTEFYVTGLLVYEKDWVTDFTDITKLLQEQE